MAKFRVTYLVLVLLLLVTALKTKGQTRKVSLDHADWIEVVFNALEDTTYAFGHVIFSSEQGTIYCDSTIYVEDKSVFMRGNVIVDDPDNRVVADSVRYNLATDAFTARGDYVELYSRLDSLMAVGTHAFYNRSTRFFYMEDRPTVYFKYPDSAAMVEVTADYVEYSAEDRVARCGGNVIIVTQDMTATAGWCFLYPDNNRIEMGEGPVLKRGRSTINGASIVISSENDMVKQIDVIDSARAEFNEPTDSAETYFDRSILKGERLILDFEYGVLDKVSCYGQAYSWYYPATEGRAAFDENSVSGDTILFDVDNNQLLKVDVIGGSRGTYVSGKRNPEDTTELVTVDTIDYRATWLSYQIIDSLITLQNQANVVSGSVSLDAERIQFDTRERLIEAFSAAIYPDTAADPYELSTELEPNEIPVRLKDGEDEFFGDYLEYAIDTEKGRIVQSKSNYEMGLYYGDKGYRQSRNIFYVRDGRYTPCDINYLHFYSKRMKLMEGEKLIARPVIMYIGRIPVMALPYYVFPLKKGRHSGFLPFTLGNIEQGNRYIRNVGYYWAASDYWDWQGALDYYDENSRINIFNRLRYKKRYVFDGYLEGNYARSTSYSYSTASESNSESWTIKGAHNHTFSPSFKLSASGNYQSSATYYQEYSADLDDRLNRTTRSEVNFTKRFGTATAISGKAYHDLNLDTKKRTDVIPSLNVSLPIIRPFGSGSRDADGKLVSRFYNNLTVRYSPSMINYSNRVTNDSITNLVYDTVITIDTLTLAEDTSITLSSADTLELRSRKEYTRFDHAINISMPTKIAKYFTFNPSFSYSENWYKLYATDQSEAAGLETGTTYRNYVYSLSSSLSTKLYGTIYPGLFGLSGVRQTITPTVKYSYTPRIDRHPDVRTYAGGVGSSSIRKTLNMGLNHFYQAKINIGGAERNLDLVSINHSFSYNFENEERPYSDLSTSFSSSILPKVNMNGSMRHSFYKVNSDELDFWHPRRLSFDFNANMTIAGKNFIFDDPADIQRGKEKAEDLVDDNAGPGGRKGWSMSVSYSYRESGSEAAFNKSSFASLNLNFYLTPSTAVTYSQYYDFARGKTINSQVSLTRKLKCWTGHFFWVPIGSNRGYGFRLFVTAIPAIKIDDSNAPGSSDYFPR